MCSNATSNCTIVAVDMSASSDPQEYNVSSSGILTCTAVFSGPQSEGLPATQFPRLEMTFAGSVVSQERAPLNYTYHQPFHHLVRVSVAGIFCY